MEQERNKNKGNKKIRFPDAAPPRRRPQWMFDSSKDVVGMLLVGAQVFRPVESWGRSGRGVGGGDGSGLKDAGRRASSGTRKTPTRAIFGALFGGPGS